METRGTHTAEVDTMLNAYISNFINNNDKKLIHIGGWFSCFPRKFNWTWDEKFKAHYQDADMVQ